MADYGITDSGINIKRLDTILDEMHTDLTNSLGVDTRQNSQSLLNHIITNFADRIAELWEYGELVYHSHIPTMAEGINLDNAVQYGGIRREKAAKSYYYIHCTGKNGTVLDTQTLICTNTSPAITFQICEESTISVESFNSCVVTFTSDIYTVESSNLGSKTYTLEINGKTCTYNSSANADLNTVVSGIASAANAKTSETGVTATYTSGSAYINLSSSSISKSNQMTIFTNLQATSVTSIIKFESLDYGDYEVENEVITEKVKANSDLESVVNKIDYIAGRTEETDEELRQSYIEKIYNRSSSMLESIESGILNEVQGVESVAAYENSTNYATFKKVLTGNESGLYYFEYNDIYFVFTMPSVSESDEFSFSSENTKTASITGSATTVVNLTAYNDITTRIYNVGVDGLANGAYYFLCEGIYYKFTLSNALVSGNKIVFNRIAKTAKTVVGTAETALTLTRSLSAPTGTLLTLESGDNESITKLEADDGIPPHSIEVVVDGGDDEDIAEVILENKAGGISTYGNKYVDLETEYGDTIRIRFSEPKPLYVWFSVTITKNPSESFPTDGETVIKDLIVEKVKELEIGETVIPQLFVEDIHNECSGIAYIDISIYSTTVELSTAPASYPKRITSVSNKQRATTTDDMVAVTIS